MENWRKYIAESVGFGQGRPPSGEFYKKQVIELEETEQINEYAQLLAMIPEILQAVEFVKDTIPEEQKEEVKDAVKSGDIKAFVRDNPDLVAQFSPAGFVLGPVAGPLGAILLSKTLEDEETGKGSVEASLERYKDRIGGIIDYFSGGETEEQQELSDEDIEKIKQDLEVGTEDKTEPASTGGEPGADIETELHEDEEHFMV